MDTFSLILIGATAFLMSGALKGLTGIGLPTASIAFMTLFLDPRTAIALVLFPMLGSNILQMARGGHLLRTMRRYFLFAIILVAGVGTTAFATQDTSDRALLAVLGIVVLIFVAVSWKGLVPPLADKYDKLAQVIMALFAGIIGGMTAAWGPPMAMYLAARGADKDEFIRATGFMITLGSLPLIVTYAQLGFMTGPLAGVSVAMLVPTFIGMSAGAAYRRKLSGEGFRNAMLIMFVFLGLNLIRRAIWYN